jgi:hypothetical protein
VTQFTAPESTDQHVGENRDLEMIAAAFSQTVERPAAAARAPSLQGLRPWLLGKKENHAFLLDSPISYLFIRLEE